MLTRLISKFFERLGILFYCGRKNGLVYLGTYQERVRSKKGHPLN